MLFTFPSRYLFTIGCQLVFSLIRWSGQIRTEFHLHRATWDTARSCLLYAHPAVTVYGRPFQVVALDGHSHVAVPQPQADKSAWFGLFRFRSPLLTESLRFLFLGLLRCFTSPRFAFAGYEFTVKSRRDTPVGCPIRRSSDQSLLAAPRSLSQLATSFIACWHQGIHHKPLVT